MQFKWFIAGKMKFMDNLTLNRMAKIGVRMQINHESSSTASYDDKPKLLMMIDEGSWCGKCPQRREESVMSGMIDF